MQGESKLLPRRTQERVNGEVLTPEEVAFVLKMELRTVQRHLKNGQLPGRKIGASWRCSRASIEALLP